MSYWRVCLGVLGILAIIAAVVALFGLFLYLWGSWGLIPLGIVYIMGLAYILYRTQ